MCGADLPRIPSRGPLAGSSPRVRSRLHVLPAERLDPGIISACAEQTWCRRWTRWLTRDHLRVCGADPEMSMNRSPESGSSPRVRSRLAHLLGGRGAVGIISACAEQTVHHGERARLHGDHLRVCGADTKALEKRADPAGSSPRVRSRLALVDLSDDRAGIISACAEQTTLFKEGKWQSRDHLRVCGADVRDRGVPVVGRGSSPRVRSRHKGQRRKILEFGIISACAEQTPP